MSLQEILKPLVCAVFVGHDWKSAQDKKDYDRKKGTGVLRTATQSCGHCDSLREVFITSHDSSWRPMTLGWRNIIDTRYKFAGSPADPYTKGPGGCI